MIHPVHELSTYIISNIKHFHTSLFHDRFLLISLVCLKFRCLRQQSGHCVNEMELSCFQPFQIFGFFYLSKLQSTRYLRQKSQKLQQKFIFLFSGKKNPNKKPSKNQVLICYSYEYSLVVVRHSLIFNSNKARKDSNPG